MSITTKVRTAYGLITKRPRGWKSLIWNTAMARLGQIGPLMAPVHVAIEPTNACNAECPVCETGKDEMPRRKGMLDFDNFKRLVDDMAGSTNSLMYYFMGEPFLNRHAYDMIRYARQKGIFVDTCTNGDFADAKGIIYSDINRVSFQLGGMTEETHQRYRVRSSLTKAKENLHALIEERRKNPESSVQIDVGLIVMRHNEHEIDAFIKWAREIGADTVNVIDPCVRNMLEGYAYLPKNKKYWYYDDAAFEKGILRPKVLPHNECQWIWNSIVINWNGDAVPCCRDPKGLYVLGNVFEDGLRRVFNSEKARDFRRRILADQGGVELCKLCSSYSLPNMNQKRPVSFEIVRHSFNTEDLVLPNGGASGQPNNPTAAVRARAG
jgi:radical SAM protein with 4Fe4S-binding SPASM domain